VQCLAANRLEGHVHAAGHRRPYLVVPAGLAVVDRNVGAQLLSQRELGRGARRGDDRTRAELPGQLHGEVADGARSGGDQDGLPGPEPSGPQRAERHRPGRRQHARGIGAELRGYRHQPVGAGHDEVGAGVLEQDRDAAPGHGRPGARAGLLDGPHHVTGQRAWQRTEPDRARVGLPAELHVDVVDADRLGPDEHLPGPGLREAGLLDGQDLGPSVRVITDTPHGNLLSVDAQAITQAKMDHRST